MAYPPQEDPTLDGSEADDFIDEDEDDEDLEDEYFISATPEEDIRPEDIDDNK